MTAAELQRGGAYATAVPGGYVSTLYRESSARVESPPWFYETMAFLEEDPGIAWQSAASYPREADRQHSLAVRWFSRFRAPTSAAQENRP